MSIERSDFESITEKDLQELVDAQVPEGLRIEFKLEHYGKSYSEKKELLKDVSALANSHGGHLILGVEETGGAASKLVGMELDADAEILRMEQITRNAIEPPIPGIRYRSIPLGTDRKVLLVRVPRSWYPPHRVTAQGTNRFYARNSAGVYEPSVEELRALFDQTASALEKAHRFRDERIQLVCRGVGRLPLEGRGRLFIHVVPTAAFSGMFQLDLRKIFEKRDAFCPLADWGKTPGFNYYGFVNELVGDKNQGYTQIFRNGCLEATKAGIVRHEGKGHLVIRGRGLEKLVFDRFSPYIVGLRDVGVPPPLIIMFTLEGVKGAKYYVGASPWEDNELPLPEPVLKLPECILEEYGTDLDHHQAVRPAFDALWNAIGYSGSRFFDENGLWEGRQSSKNT